MNSLLDEHERTMAFAEVALGQIRSLRQTAVPRNYEIWYVYATGYNPALNKIINETLARNGYIAVTFDFLGQGTPGSQSFALLDSASFTTILEGRTSLAGAAVPVPEPGALVLAVTALLAAVGGCWSTRNRLDRKVL